MNIALVAMPWSQFDSPSAALGVLSALIRRDRPDMGLDCHYAYLDMWQRIETVYEPIGRSLEAELVYLPLLYPERRETLFQPFEAVLERWRANPLMTLTIHDARELVEQLLHAAGDNVEHTLEALGDRYQVVGFTVMYSQLFSSLVVAKRLKERFPFVKVVFGGAGVDGECGRSILSEYPFVDYAVQGEGEVPFLSLVDGLQAGETGDNIPGVWTRNNWQGNGTRFTADQRLANQVSDLDSLPVPDYQGYIEQAETLNLYWHMPLETSRGCWWNRSLTTGDPLRACYFCNLNLGSYREKPAERVAAEIRTLTSRYSNVRLHLMDNVLRRKGLEEMLIRIGEIDADLRFVAEVRASIRPYELLLLREAGCHHVQIGIEGLSSAYLRRLGKGATTIQNLQAMKTCFELGIGSASNLLPDFPGATQEEVDETVHNILNYAIAYEPTDTSRFALLYNSSVYHVPEEFGVSNVRMYAPFASALPGDVAERLRMFWFDYDVDAGVDWTPVTDAVSRWKALHEILSEQRTFSRKPLFYTDGGTFLEIVDRRDGFRLVTLEGEWRTLYLYCMEIRRVEEVTARLADQCDREKVQEMLNACVAEHLMFFEFGKCLSLAPAVTPVAASRRIRKAHEVETGMA